MLLIPFETITYKTNLSKDEVVSRLMQNVAPLKRWNFKSDSSEKKYLGSFDGDRFDIFRKVKGRNSFLPMIFGVITTDDDQVVIKIKMRLHLIVILFLLVWCSFIGVGVFRDIHQQVDNNWIIGVGMILSAYLMTIIFFYLEK